ncbi:MAG TPA: flavodoxin family protein [Erysipelotrichaceae bacterium]|nr:flavodoxin family protein [Erysipelotrichaceae bacterium]HQB31919.1 flavodoxin family protein [Erysipelotrichaceae bacterium]
MKVILVNGSPHLKGTTNAALEEICKVLKEENIETEIFWLGNEPIAGCIGCQACRKNQTGCFRNDIVNQFQEKAKEADGFIFGSPVHYAGASGALTTFLDRLFYSADRETFRLKPAAVIAAARRAGATSAYSQLIKYLGISEMLIISSGYWNMVFGSNAADAKEDLEGLQTMRTLARNMAYCLKCIEAGKKTGLELPETEKEKFRTNFVR